MGCVWIVRLCYCGFELAGATLSPTRISRRPDRSCSLTLRGGTSPRSPTWSLQEWKYIACLRLFCFIPLGPELTCVFDITMSFCVSISFDLHLFSSVDVLWRVLVTPSSYTQPVLTPFTSTSLLCWNGWRLLFNVLLLLDRCQLYSVSTVPVVPPGAALETSVSYQHYWCCVSVDLHTPPLSGIRHPVSFLCPRFLPCHPLSLFLLPGSPYLYSWA